MRAQPPPKMKSFNTEVIGIRGKVVSKRSILSQAESRTDTNSNTKSTRKQLLCFFELMYFLWSLSRLRVQRSNGPTASVLFVLLLTFGPPRMTYFSMTKTKSNLCESSTPKLKKTFTIKICSLGIGLCHTRFKMIYTRHRVQQHLPTSVSCF